MSENPQRFLDVALAAVKLAEPIFIKSFGNASGIETKSGATHSQVSAADKEIEKLLVKEITAAFPEHAIVGEEETAKQGGVYTWYIDPIDGTTNYIHGLHHCSISVALWDAHGPLVGIVADPVNKVTFTAVRGGGAFKNGKPIHVSHTSSLRQAVGSLGWDWADPRSRSELCDKVGKSAYRFRVFSGTALEICFVASGVHDFFASISVNIWDMAAAILVLTEAGGMVSDKKGADITPFSKTLVGTNAKIHGDLLAALK